MGIGPAFAGALALHDSNGWFFSVELSLATFFSFDSGDLRGRSAARAPGTIDPGYGGTRSRCRYGRCDVNSAYDERVRFPADMDLSRTRGNLVAVNILVARF